MTSDFGADVRSALIEELQELYQAIGKIADGLTDEQMWMRPLEQSNSVGHLILHLTGNLNYFVGAHLGKTGYQRDREREFTEAKPPSRTELLQGLGDAVALFRRVVGSLTVEQMAAPHPETRFGTVVKALVHLVAHFALHRGQMSYLARLVKA
jgi:uncharacterized damage-inducible protein DinB